MKYILGVDGGGTKTKYILSDTMGNIVAEHVGPTIHYLQVGINGLKENLTHGIQTVLNKIDKNLSDLDGAFIGTPGYGDILDDRKKLQEAVASVLNDVPHSIGNDTDNAHAGSLALKPGIIVIAGTGSIGLGINEQDERMTSGGWHHNFHGDEGSAHWISERYIQEFTKQSDKRVPKTLLYEFMKEKHGFIEDSMALQKFIIDWKYDRTKIASLAVEVSELAYKNDEVALKIFDEAAYEISLIYRSIINHLDFENKPISLSYVGGVFNSGKIIFEPLKTYLKDLDVEIKKPEFSPEMGSILIGFKNANIDLTSNILNNLKKY